MDSPPSPFLERLFRKTLLPENPTQTFLDNVIFLKCICNFSRLVKGLFPLNLLG